jgi:hypothetical protein
VKTQKGYFQAVLSWFGRETSTRSGLVGHAWFLSGWKNPKALNNIGSRKYDKGDYIFDG